MDKSSFRIKKHTSNDPSGGSKVKEAKKGSQNPEVELLKNQLARVLADYDNLRKRTDAEKDLWIKFSSQRILTTMLPILDNFESAQKHLNNSGLAIAIGEFKRVFTEEGLEEIVPEVGNTFDNNENEAVEIVEISEQDQDGKIAEVVLSGWKYKGEDSLNEGKLIIRHAKVKVYKAKR
ncbi:MAG: Protein GrpE [Candidatus Woesebacteria bacterium GW2011_GWA1_39_21]|uniref:Protein GrpE n=1 Tax=Candidatus Woesebacteria bacterium GW2011_GWA1_39_21 TaxID=1618550 RepID=A0A0G0NFW1_9BACT|nr:MAG: Protein GrpE [Candidatus Woesebacteria bacterium GW2011_GWA1_39_21]